MPNNEHAGNDNFKLLNGDIYKIGGVFAFALSLLRVGGSDPVSGLVVRRDSLREKTGFVIKPKIRFSRTT